MVATSISPLNQGRATHHPKNPTFRDRCSGSITNPTMKPTHSTRKNLTSLARLAFKAVSGVILAALMFALYYVTIWLLFAASTPHPSEL
jgi:hypothetical protein